MLRRPEKLFVRFAPRLQLYCASLVAKLKAPCVANPDQDTERLFANDAAVLVHDGGLFTTRHQQQRAGEREDEQAMEKNQTAEKPQCTQRAPTYRSLGCWQQTPVFP